MLFFVYESSIPAISDRADGLSWFYSYKKHISVCPEKNLGKNLTSLSNHWDFAIMAGITSQWSLLSPLLHQGK